MLKQIPKMGLSDSTTNFFCLKEFEANADTANTKT